MEMEAKMSNEIDDAESVSVTIRRGDPDWLIGVGASFEGDTEESAVGNPELAGMPKDKSLVETEIMLTAWLVGRGFTLSSHWRTHEYSGAGRVFEARAEFTRE
jgi:hypothetical protein